ncbi:hypothetical protein [Szabonella alba]|uniref:Outer membrane protein beta-barrel domain-containing protein n=1 Tax=Szabonella alba TaxID=2804194 RepID=A0A8K0V6Q5_9RHOB|nr:hypothetical protein [Szabonella alba]MBL4916388.1 hypothetical protein [Szabonella alba]
MPLRPALALLLGLCLPLATPAKADPTVGVGVSILFGGESALGMRIFSDDRRDRAAASVGLDYVFRSQRIRPTLGVAYLMRNAYIGLDMGLDLEQRGVDFSAGLGVTKTTRRTPAAAPPPPATAAAAAN